MKKLLLVAFLIILLSFSTASIAVEEKEDQKKGFFSWLSKLFSIDKKSPNTKTNNSEPALNKLSPSMLGDAELETTSTVKATKTYDSNCDITICVTNKKEVHCRDAFSTCETKYDSCRRVSCNLNLALAPPCVASNNSVTTNKNPPSFKQYIAQVTCDKAQHTCYYLNKPSKTENGFIDYNMLAVTCQGTLVECSARYEKCECGIKTDTCSKTKNTCFNQGQDSVCEEGSQEFCLMKNEDCACGESHGCESTGNRCYQENTIYGCSADYKTCLGRYKNCDCGKPGAGCTETKHSCYDSTQTTTKYLPPKKVVCEGSYKSCTLKHAQCDCGLNAKDPSCPLKQHSCLDAGKEIICNGLLKDCSATYDSCDCGIQTYSANITKA